jgi:hypothetical protein
MRGVLSAPEKRRHPLMTVLTSTQLVPTGGVPAFQLIICDWNCPITRMSPSHIAASF